MKTAIRTGGQCDATKLAITRLDSAIGLGWIDAISVCLLIRISFYCKIELLCELLLRCPR